MTDLTPIQSAAMLIAAVGGVLGVLGVLTKRRRDALTRLIDREEAELARNKAD